MKKEIAMLLCICLILTCFAGCTTISKENPNKISVLFMTDTNGFKGKDDTNRQVKSALETLKRDVDISLSYQEGKDKERYAPDLRALAEGKKHNVILTAGYATSRAVDSIAKDYPQQLFVTIDQPVNKDNVLSIVFREEESSFYNGVLAALMTKTNAVGYIASFEGQNMQYLYGFLLGVRAVDPNIAIHTAYTSSYTDLATGQTVTEKLKNAGADIVYSCAAAPTSSVIDYAQQNGMLVINSDIYKYDQSSKALISITRKKYKSSVEYIISAAIEALKGEKTTPGGINTEIRYVGIAQDAFEFSLGSSVPKEIQEKLEAVKIMFTNSEIVVPTDEAGYSGFDLGIFQGKTFKK